jgi:hypothetical protein
MIPNTFTNQVPPAAEPIAEEDNRSFTVFVTYDGRRERFAAVLRRK